VPTLPAIFIDELHSLPIERLSLRIACRPTHWPDELETMCRRVWQDQGTGIFLLTPLSREDVVRACESEGMDGTRFLEEVGRLGLEPLACKPRTLHYLMNIFQAEARLFPTRREVYEEGAYLLCTDAADGHRVRDLRTTSADERLKTAARMAALSQVLQRPSVITASVGSRYVLSVRDLAGAPEEEAKGIAFPVTEVCVLEALDTGLFTAAGDAPGILTWTHQAVVEFLAAKYLLEREVPEEQLFGLLRASVGEQVIAPPLYNLAGWLAARHRRFRERLLRQDPTLLLRGDVTALEAEVRADLVRELLRAAEDHRVSPWDLRHSPALAHLQCPQLPEILRAVLTGEHSGEPALVLAVSIAEACRTQEVQGNLVQIALDTARPRWVRVCAAYAVGSVADSSIRSRLQPLLAGSPDDPEEELRGCALKALWPDLLTAGELFSHLSYPLRSNFFGAYQGFLREFTEQLRPEDLPSALAWVRDQGPHITEALNALSESAKGILRLAWEHLSDPRVRDLYADIALAQMEEYRLSLPMAGSGQELADPADQQARALLARRVLERGRNRIRHPVDIYGVGDTGLLHGTDEVWLLEAAEQAETTDERMFYIRVAGWVGGYTSPDALERLWRMIAKEPKLHDEFRQIVGPVQLNSDIADEMRTSYREAIRWQEETRLRREATQRRALAAQEKILVRLNQNLERFEGGDLDAWWKLFWALHMTPEEHTYQNPFHYDVTSSPGWNAADDALRARLVAAARRYVLEFTPQYDWVGTDTIRHPEYGGYMALDLLYEADTSFVSGLNEAVWEKWAPVTVAYFRSNVDNSWDRQIELIQMAYQYTPVAIVDTLQKVVRYALTQQGFLPSVLSDRRLVYDSRVWEMALGLASESDVPKAQKPPLVERVLWATRDSDTDLHERASRFLAGWIDDEEIGTHAAMLLFAFARGAGWDVLWPRIEGDEAFGKRFVLKTGGRMFLAERPLEELTPRQVAELYLRVVRWFPPDEDPEAEGFHEVGGREQVGHWRNTLLRCLTQQETPAACDALAFLNNEIPEMPWLRDLLRRAEEAVMRSLWQPPTARYVLDLLKRRERRFIQSADHLMEVLMEQLQELGERLFGEIPQVESLWDRRRPKNEEALSNFVAAFLKDRLAGSGVVVGREVQIHHVRDRLDIRVDAVRTLPSGEHDRVSVVIEVKGCWNRELKTAMRTQLVDQYLRPWEVKHGIYLVGWFLCDAWEAKGDGRKADAVRHGWDRENAVKELHTIAQEVSDEKNLTIQPFVLNAVRQTTSKKSRSRTGVTGRGGDPGRADDRPSVQPTVLGG
jgi:hypothetical protein